MEEKKSNKKIVLIVVAIILLIAVCTGLYFLNASSHEDAVEGAKSITLQIADERDSYSFEEKYSTDEEYLGNFLDSEGIIGFTESQYGRYITSVQGYEAKDDDQSWWCISVNGESAVTGADEIVINDGDTYMLELKIGY